MPIELKIELNAVKTAIRLKTDDNWYGNYTANMKGKLLSHAYYLNKKLEMISSYTEGNASDLIPKTSFNNNFIVNFTTNEECIERINNLSASEVSIYTDGSLIKNNQANNLAGAGFTVMQDNDTLYEQSYSLGTLASVNQCELFAINQAAHWILTTSPNNRRFNIFSYSKSTLHKLEKGCTQSKMTLETIETLNEICLNNTVVLFKVPAHTGIQGNEKADYLAKKGAMTRPTAPEPVTGFTWNNMMTEIIIKILQKQETKIMNHNIKSEHKTPVLSYLQKYGNKMIFKDRNKISLFTQIISGQNHLANNHSKRDPTVVPFCRHCPNIKETADHFLLSCPAYSLQRIQIFGHTSIALKDLVSKYKPSAIVKFVNNTGRFEDKYICYYIE